MKSSAELYERGVNNFLMKVWQFPLKGFCEPG